ncbi:protein hold'em [Phlebotomus argentipes]|uniref:protein hold'em n=1 Tax=Phlebotomus argentipes TaxID=94469 RepID=UPI002892C2BD|nr:protein hold'em [Phlebotomus argentipes]
MEVVVRCWIKNLEYLREDTRNVSIVGIIVGKSEAKIFDSAEGEARGVFTLTLRDSIRDTINCVFWGSKDFILTTNKAFKYGDVVNVVEARVSSPERSGFQPVSSSQFLLTVNEDKGKIYQYTGPQENFRKFLRVPLKSMALTLSLADVNSRGELTSGDFVDVLVIVRAIRPAREVKTRFGKITQCREIIVADKTFPGMLLTFWGKCCDERIDSWKPLKTSLMLYDVKSDFSSFHRAVILSFTSRTLITEDVEAPEAEDLIAYAANMPIIEGFSLDTNDLPAPEHIRSVMSVQQVLDRAEGQLNAGNDTQFTALIYAVITKLDLDGFSRIVTERCAFCKKIINGECAEADCALLQFNGSQMNIVTFEILVDLSDHTGTLANCRLVSDAAERLLGLTPGQFLLLSPDQRSQLKWATLLERCAVKVVVRKKSIFRPRMWIGVVECRLADCEDVARNIKVY